MAGSWRGAIWCATFILSFSCQSTVSAQDLGLYRGQDPKILFEEAWRSPSNAEKVAIRTYLVRNFTSTEYGCFSKAWLSGYEVDGHSRDYYQKCVDRYPDFLPALWNLHEEMPRSSERIPVLERILAIDPSYEDYGAIRDTYFLYLDDLKDPTCAHSFLTQWEQRLPGIFIFDFIRGLEEQYDHKDWAKARSFYDKAILANPRFLEVRMKIADAEIARMAQEGQDLEAQAKGLSPLLNFIENLGEVHSSQDQTLLYRALIDLGDLCWQRLNSEGSARAFYEKAFNELPTVEAALAAANATRNFDQERHTLEEALSKFPSRPQILYSIASAEPDTALARKYYEKAISFSLTLKDEYDAASNMAGDLLEDRLLDYDAAEEVYRKYLPQLSDRNLALVPWYENRREAGKYAEARKYLDEDEVFLEQKNSVNKAWFRSRRLELDEFLGAEAASESFYKRNPFLRSWRQQFGDSLQATIHFSLGSDAILPSDFGTLRTLAEALNQQGAEQYVFAVEGRAPGTGPEAANRSASLRLSQAVVDHLNRVDGVPLSRLRATAGVPVGAADGRRVEILPVGNTSEPEIVATSALTANSELALDPAGRYMALGTNPMELWDVAQEVRLKSLGSCGYRVFSPNGRYLACTSTREDAGGYERYAIIVCDVATGLRVAQIALPNRASLLAWSPESTQIVFTTSKPQIVIFDVTQKRRVRTAPIPGGVHIVSEGIVWTKDGHYIVSGLAQANELLVWNPADLTVVRKLDGIRWPHSLRETADGLYLVCADNNFTLSVWDEAGFELRQFSIGVLSNKMSIHPTKPLVLLDDFSNLGHQTLLLFDVVKMKILATRETRVHASAAFTADGNRVLSAESNRLLVLDPASLEQTGEITGSAEPAVDGASSAKNGYYLILDGNGVHVWDVTTGHKVHIWRQKFDEIRPLDHAGRFLAFRGDAHAGTTTVTLLDTNTFEASAWATVPMTVDAVSVTERRIAFAGTPFMPANEGSDTGTICIYDRSTQSLNVSFSVPLVTAALEYDGIYRSGFASLALTEAGDEVAVVSWWQDGFGHGRTMSRLARIFNVSTSKIRGRVEIRSAISSVAFEGEGDRYLDVTSGSSTGVYRTSDLVWERNADVASGEATFRLASGESLHWAVNYVRTTHAVLPMPEMIHAAVFEDQNLFVTLNSRNEIIFYDLKTFDPKLTVVNKKGGEWIAYAPSGEFTSSLHGADKVYWSLGYHYVEFDALRERFEKPRVIAEHLRVLARGAAAAPTAPPAINPELFALPYSLEVISKNNFDTTAASYDLELRVTKLTSDLPDPEIVYTQQGRPADAAKGIRVHGTGDQVVRCSFDLGEGMNVIQANVSFKGATLPGPVVIVNRTVPHVALDARPLTSLWFFGVGISRYEHEEKVHRLSYADRDVEQVSSLFQRQQGKLYLQVKIRLMRNEEAKAQDVRVQMNNFLRQAADQDLVVIMLSAHGINDNGDLYLVTNDADPDQPYTGLNLRDVRDFLAHRPPNQKAIIWIDICHAGAFGPGVEKAKGRLSADDAIKELAQGTGLIVMASSTASEDSLESADYDGGHGAFSAAVIEALSGQTRTQSAGEEGILTVLQLNSYVVTRVPAMTHGHQHPTVAEAQQFRDFPIALPFN
jgi:WD40 repeat protein/outer membrane protein OmpA-like peptidoglycan-associated protein